MRFRPIVILAAIVAVASVSAAMAQGFAPYKVVSTKMIGGEGRYDYVYADAGARRLYVPRLGPAGSISVFDLDTLAPVGSIPNTSAHGVAVDEASHHAFASSKPVAMWDSQSLQMIKTIDVQGGPDAITADPFNGRIYVMSHSAPNATVIDGKSGSVVGTIDLGGAPEQTVSDGNGHLYVALEDRTYLAVIDARTMTVATHYDLGGQGGSCSGLAIDRKNNILFVACHDPHTMVAMNAADGRIVGVLPIGSGTDGAAFNPATMEAFSAQSDGTLSVVKEINPTTFMLAQTLHTKPGAKTLTVDGQTNRVFTIAANFATPAPAAPGAQPGRPEMIPGTLSILVVGK